MRKKLFYILLLFLFSINLYSNDSRKFFFWEVLDTSSTNTTYLLGSIHFGNENIFPLTESINQAFEKSDAIAIEFNPENVEPISLLQRGLSIGKKTLKQRLSDTTYNLIASKLKQFGINDAIFNNFKPWFAALLVSNIYYVNTGLSAQHGIELHFIEKAKEKNKLIEELESLEEQIEVFDGIPEIYDEQLVRFILNETIIEEDMDKFIDNYIKGDDEALEKYLFTDELINDDFQNILKSRLVINRNISMANKIEEFHKSGRIHFVIAGAAHFVGRDGIIEILKKRNYIVKRI